MIAPFVPPGADAYSSFPIRAYPLRPPSPTLMHQPRFQLGRIVRDNMRRAITIACLVGTILVLINHGDHIEMEPVCDFFFLKCGLSYLVPFAVSMVSGILSARESLTIRKTTRPG